MSVSKAQRRATAIALHHPEKLHAKNRGLLKMSAGQLHEFASTKEKGLPKTKAGKRLARIRKKHKKKHHKKKHHRR